jgi:hypothetical protein
MVPLPSSPKAIISLLVLFLIFLALSLSAPGITVGSELFGNDTLLNLGEEQRVHSDATVISSNSDAIVFEVRPPEFEETAIATNSGIFKKVRIPGYDYIGVEGHPDLPQTSFLVAIPPGAVPRLTLVDSQSHKAEEIRVLPTAKQNLVNDPPLTAAEIKDFTPEFETSFPTAQEIYTSDELYPASPVALGEELWLRDLRVVRVHVYPIQANSPRQSLNIFSYLKIQLAFTAGDGTESQALETRQEGPAFEPLLSENILNYEQSGGWRLHREFDAVPQTSPCMEGNAFRLAVTDTGMHQVTYGELSSVGWLSGVSTQEIQMCYQDAEIAIRVLDSGTVGVFDPSDSLIFYGQAIKTQETENNIYWLSYVDGTSGKRMSTDTNSAGGATPAKYQVNDRLETDTVYFSSMPMSDANDHWYWRNPLVGRNGDPNQSMSVEYDLPNPVTGDGSTFPLRVMLWAFLRDESHRVEVRLNGNSLGQVDFFGSGLNSDSLLYEADVPSSYLDSDGTNTISIVALPHPSNPADYPHRILVDWIELEPYRNLVALDNHLPIRLTPNGLEDTTVIASGFTPGNNTVVDIYDVTDIQNVSRQRTNASSGTLSFRRILSAETSFELVVPGFLLTPNSITADAIPSPLLSDLSNEADMIIVTDPSLNSALTPLKSLRSSQGLEVKTVFVQDIFDEFSYGVYSTEAIKDFLAYAYENWSGDREYVLLAGEGSYDHRDVLGLNGPGGNLVPVYLRSGIDLNLGEAASDNQFVDFDGDDLADMMLGRLPARDSTELSTMVDKILAYEAGPTTAPWRAKHLFVTDNGLVPSESGCSQDPASDFFAVVDSFIDNFFPDEHLLHRINYAPTQCYPDPEPYYAQTVLQMQTGIVQKYNAGNQFVIYTGHSGSRNWGHENFFNQQLANGLENGDHTPVMLPMTCLVGIYHFPQGDNLSETLLKLNGGGSVAAYAPTGLQVQNGHDYLLEGFYTSIFDDGDRILGQAIYKAKLNLDSGPSSYQDLHDTFMLLGDPAMRIDMPEYVEQNYLPLTTN